METLNDEKIICDNNFNEWNESFILKLKQSALLCKDQYA